MKEYKILIAENIPSLNKGEVTIFEGLIEAFNKMGSIQYSMLSQHPDIDRPRYKETVQIIDLTKHCFLFSRYYYESRIVKFLTAGIFLLNHFVFLIAFFFINKHILKIYRDDLWKSYIHSDIIIIGHDGSYGTGGGQAMPLFYPLLLPVFAKKLGKKVIMPGGSIHELERPKWLTEKLYRYSLNHFDLITLRERISYETFLKLNTQQKNCFLTADLAFLMNPISKQNAQALLQKEGIDESVKRPLIGIVITREKASISVEGLNRPEECYKWHVKVIADIIDNIIYTTNASIIFIPHCIGIGDNFDDRIVHEDIYQICKNKKQIRVINTEYDAKELKGILGECDLFISERLHAAINALTMNVPTIIISNSTDQRLDIIKMMGQESSVLFIDSFLEEKLKDKIIQALKTKKEIKKILELNVMKNREYAIQNQALIKSLK